jgi:hypothetical protein
MRESREKFDWGISDFLSKLWEGIDLLMEP